MKITRYNSRSDRGLMASLVFAILIMAAFMVGSLALDIGHGVFVRTQLQAAGDAGALAGAQELAKNNLLPADINNASIYAYNVTAANKADALAVSNATPDTNVVVVVDAVSMPRTVTVTATRNISFLFSRLFGCWSSPITTISVGGASQGLLKLPPGQLKPIAVSLNVVPTSGPQNGKALNTYVGPDNVISNNPFTIVLNPQGAKNGAWLRQDALEMQQLVFDQTTGVFNGTQANKVKTISVGDLLYLPLILDGPPFNNARVIIGVFGFTVTQIKLPNQITGLITDPVILRGTPGMPLSSATSSQDNLFLFQHGPWKVALIR